MNKIEPPFLRERIRDERRFWSSEQKRFISFFQENLPNLAAEFQRRDEFRSEKRKSDSDKSADIKLATSFRSRKHQLTQESVRQMIRKRTN